MADEHESIGKHLRRIREERGLGIKTAGKALDISYTYLSKVENGHKLPTPELLEKLSQLYDTDAEQLMARIAELPPDIQSIIKDRGKEVFDLLRSVYLPSSKKARQKNR